jgi:hypothetical protein
VRRGGASTRDISEDRKLSHGGGGRVVAVVVECRVFMW